MVYVAKVHGEYMTQSGKDRVLRAYEATFRLPSAEAPLSVIKGRLLQKFLKSIDPLAIRAYTYYLDEIYPEQGAFRPNDIPIAFQSFDQLKEYCEQNELPVPVEEYKDLDLCRAHVELAKTDLESFKVVYAKLKKKIAEDSQLEELNQGFVGIGSVSAEEVEIDSRTGKAKIAKGKAILAQAEPVTAQTAKRAPKAKKAEPKEDDILS